MATLATTTGGSGSGGFFGERLLYLLSGFVIGCVVSSMWMKQQQQQQRQDQARQFLQRHVFGRFGRDDDDDDKDDDNDNDNDDNDDEDEKRATSRGLLLQDDDKDKEWEYPPDFLTGMMSELWEYLNPTASDLIRTSLESTLESYNLTLLEVDLGSSPLHVDHVVVHPASKSSLCLAWDMDVIWDGSCRISLSSPLGPLGVAAVKLQGRLAFWMKPLTSESIACFRAMTMAFVHPPIMDLEFTGLAQVAELSLLQRTVRQTLCDAVSSMLVLPHRMVVTKMTLPRDTTWWHMYEPPLGLLEVTVWKGHGFQIEKRVLGLDDVPDVYVQVDLGGGGSTVQRQRTRTIRDCLTPSWGPHGQVLRVDACWHPEQVVTFRAWDQDSGPLDPDDDLGAAQRTVRQLLSSSSSSSSSSSGEPKPNNDKDTTAAAPPPPPPKQQELQLLDPQQPERHVSTGAYITVSCRLLPLVPPLPSFQVPKSTETANDTMYGLLTLFVIQAFEVPHETAATFVKATVQYTGRKDDNDNDETFVTSTIRDEPLEPLYDAHFVINLTKPLEGIVLTLMQESSSSSSASSTLSSTSSHPKNDILGTTRVTLSDLVEAPNGNLYRDCHWLDPPQAAAQEEKKEKGRNASHKSPTPLLTFGIMLRVVAPRDEEEEEEEEDDDNDDDNDEDKKVKRDRSMSVTTTTRGITLPTPVKKQRPPLVEQYCRENSRRLYRQFSRRLSHSSLSSSTTRTNHQRVTTKRPQTRRLRLTILRGNGFPVVHGLFTTEFPNVYCHVQWIRVAKGEGSDGDNDHDKTTTTTSTSSVMEEWRSSTLHHTTTPQWNESKEFVLEKSKHEKNLLIFSAYKDADDDKDDNDKDKDDVLLGRATVTVESLLQTQEETIVELYTPDEKKVSTSAKIVVQCQVVW